MKIFNVDSITYKMKSPQNVAEVLYKRINFFQNLKW